MQRINTLIIPAAALLLYSCGAPASGKNTNFKAGADTIPVQVITLGQPAGTPAGIAISGQFTTDDETPLSFKTGGIIHSILVKEGDRVHAGQLLATLDLTEINAQVQQAQLGLEKAQRDFQRVQHLYADSVATLEQMQNAKTALDLAAQQAASARFNQNYSEIRAGQDGYVLRKLANPGEVVSPGTPILQTNGAGTKGWLLRVGLSDRQWAQVRIGDKASVETGALPGQTLSGAVSRKSEGVDPATGTFSADIRVGDGYHGALAAGLFGKGVILPSAQALSTSQHGPWNIPYQSVLDGDGSSGYVFVTYDRVLAHKVRVRLGAMEKDHVVITEGLEGSGFLIVSGSAYLTDSSPIRVTPSTPMP